MNSLHLSLASWLVTYLVHSSLLFALAWAIDRLGILCDPRRREQLWRAALFGALLTSTAQSLQPVRTSPLASLARIVPISRLAQLAEPAVLPATESSRPRAAEFVGAGAGFASLGSVESPASAEAPAAAPKAGSGFLAQWPGTESRPISPGSSGREGWTEAIARIWLAGAALFGLRLLILGALARRELARRVPADRSLAGELAALCSDFDRLPPTLSVAPRLAGPVSLPNGEIVLPAWVGNDLDAPRRRAILAHELAHQVRRDPQWLVLALALDTLLWLQPLHRFVRRRLVALAELQADAWAVRAIRDPRALAESLAYCAERLFSNHVALWSAGMFGRNNSPGPLLERVDLLLKGNAMSTPKTPWPMRCAVGLALVAGTFLLPGCSPSGLGAMSTHSSTSVSVGDDGNTSVSMTRTGYSMKMKSSGKVTFAADESDVATLSPGGTFELHEKLDGVEHDYTLISDHQGTLTRTYALGGSAAPLDSSARAWLAQALPRMFRESGFDAEARVARLLASGGPDRVLAEVDLGGSDYSKATYLGRLFAVVQLDAATIDRALASAAKIDSDYELRRTLDAAIKTQALADAQWTSLLRTAKQLSSDYEMAELLIPVAAKIPVAAGSGAPEAWLAAALEIESDYELRRTFDAALAHDPEPHFVAAILTNAGERLDSDFELRSLLEHVADRGGDPGVARAYLAATLKLDSPFERSTALVALLDKARLDETALNAALENTAGISGNFEKLTVLQKIAPSIASLPDLDRRYREIARTLGEFERGTALRALDDAAR
ncbi:MAG: M56 family metallopeptidase [Thermoanaerobaculia bacterium]